MRKDMQHLSCAIDCEEYLQISNKSPKIVKW